MAYQIESLVHVDQVMVLITQSDRELSRLEFELTTYTQQEEQSGYREATLASDILRAEARLEKAETDLAATPETDERYAQREIDRDAASLNLRRLRLRQDSLGGLAVVERIVEETRTVALLELERDYNNALKAHRDTLEANAA